MGNVDVNRIEKERRIGIVYLGLWIKNNQEWVGEDEVEGELDWCYQPTLKHLPYSPFLNSIQILTTHLIPTHNLFIPISAAPPVSFQL